MSYSANAVRYFVNGRELTADEFEAHNAGNLREMLKQQRPPASPGAQTWPMISEAMAVHPSQIAEAMAEDKKHGVPVEYLPDGRVKYTGPLQRKKHIEKHGFFDRNGGYMDPSPSSVTFDSSKPDLEDRPD